MERCTTPLTGEHCVDEIHLHTLPGQSPHVLGLPWSLVNEVPSGSIISVYVHPRGQCRAKEKKILLDIDRVRKTGVVFPVGNRPERNISYTLKEKTYILNLTLVEVKQQEEEEKPPTVKRPPQPIDDTKPKFRLPPPLTSKVTQPLPKKIKTEVSAARSAAPARRLPPGAKESIALPPPPPPPPKKQVIKIPNFPRGPPPIKAIPIPAPKPVTAPTPAPPAMVRLDKPLVGSDMLPIYYLKQCPALDVLTGKTPDNIPDTVSLELAEKCLRHYCSYLCVDYMGNTAMAINYLEQNLGDPVSEFLGCHLFHKFIRPTLSPQDTKKMLDVEKRLTAARCAKWTRETPSRTIIAAMDSSSFLGTTPLAGEDYKDVNQRLALCNEQAIQYIGRYRKSKKDREQAKCLNPAVVEVVTRCYTCAFEDALFAVTNRLCLIRDGECKLPPRVAFWMSVNSSIDTLHKLHPDRFWNFYHANLGSSPVAQSMFTHMKQGLLENSASTTNWVGAIKDGRHPEGVTMGPMCAAQLSHVLENTHHLFHDQRVHLLKLLADCGFDEETAADYIYDRMSAEAKKSLKKKAIEQGFQSYCMEKNGPMLEEPTWKCYAYANIYKKKPYTGCPWTRVKHDKAPDIEDLLTAQGFQGEQIKSLTVQLEDPRANCKMHFDKLAARVNPSALFKLRSHTIKNALEFIAALYRT